MLSKVKYLFIFVVIGGLYAFIPPVNPSDTPEITTDELLEHIKYLSSDELSGRFPGSEGDRLARNYIAAEYKKSGLKPVIGSTYLQEFPIVTNMELGDNNSFNLSIDGKTTEYDAGESFTPYGFSKKGKAQGNLVFVGYGITAPELNYDDYKDKNGNALDISGKILIMFRNSPAASDPHDNSFSKYEPSRFKTITPREGKAAGVIFVSGYDLGDEDNLVSVMYDRVLQDAGIPVIHSKREAIEKVFKANGLSLKEVLQGINSSKKSNSFALAKGSAEFTTDVKPITVNTTNILGMIEGSDPVLKNEVIVIGAHYDHLGYGDYGSLYGKKDKIHYGADDNASGTAGVIELAEKFSSEKANLQRSILFMCFGAEEAGLLGSAHFTNSPEFKQFNIVSMINMDMIGRLDAEKLVIYGTGTSPFWESNLNEINKTYNFNITYTPDGFGPSDHSSFYVKDIPVLHFFSGTHNDYHKPSDTYEKINYPGTQKILMMVYDITSRLDDLQNKPEFTKAAADNTQPVVRFNVSLGTIPDYSYSGKGLKISGVRAGGPAEAAGLQGGDIIVKMGSLEIGNIYDYMSALSKHKAGDEVDIVILRNNEEKTVKVVMEGKK
jgi:hypothetical protein